MHTIYTNKPEEAKGVFGVQVDDPQSADIILIVIPDDPSIGDAVNIMVWSFVRTTGCACLLGHD